jgi:hypothetical protein
MTATSTCLASSDPTRRTWPYFTARRTSQPVRIVRKRIREDFERDIAIELRIARAKYLAHPAFGNLRGDFVDAEARAGSEGQVADYTGRTGRRTR